MKQLKILTYNIQFGKHTDSIIDWINRQPDYDIFCFQEFPHHKIKDSLVVLGRLPYGYTFTPSIQRRGALYGQLTLYRKDKMKLEKNQILSLGINRVERSLIRNTIARTCLLSTFRFQKTLITIANVHFVALTINKYKYRQVDAVVNRLQNKRHPIIVLGDFNLSSIIGKKKLFFIMGQYGYTTDHTRISTYRVGVFRHQFDYIFGKNCSIKYEKIQTIRLSDHLPVSSHVYIA